MGTIRGMFCVFLGVSRDNDQSTVAALFLACILFHFTIIMFLLWFLHNKREEVQNNLPNTQLAFQMHSRWFSLLKGPDGGQFEPDYSHVLRRVRRRRQSSPPHRPARAGPCLCGRARRPAALLWHRLQTVNQNIFRNETLASVCFPLIIISSCVSGSLEMSNTMNINMFIL